MGKLQVQVVACRGVPQHKLKVRLEIGERDYTTVAVEAPDGCPDFSAERFSFFVDDHHVPTGKDGKLVLDLLEVGFLGDKIIGSIHVDLAKIPRHQTHKFALPWSGCGGQAFCVIEPDFGPDVNPQAQAQSPLQQQAAPQPQLPPQPQPQAAPAVYQGQVQQQGSPMYPPPPQQQQQPQQQPPQMYQQQPQQAQPAFDPRLQQQQQHQQQVWFGQQQMQYYQMPQGGGGGGGMYPPVAMPANVAPVPQPGAQYYNPQAQPMAAAYGGAAPTAGYPAMGAPLGYPQYPMGAAPPVGAAAYPGFDDVSKKNTSGAPVGAASGYPAVGGVAQTQQQQQQQPPQANSRIGAGDLEIVGGVAIDPAVGAVVAPSPAAAAASSSSSSASSPPQASSEPGKGMPNPPPGAMELGRDVNGEHLGGVIIRDNAVSGARLEGAWVYDAHVRNSQIIGGAYEGVSFKSCNLFGVLHMYRCKYEDCTIDAQCVLTKPKSLNRTENNGKVL